jgi:hypothetical protein
MPGEQAPTTTTRSGRVYPTFTAATVVAIVNSRRELLLLENPGLRTRPRAAAREGRRR